MKQTKEIMEQVSPYNKKAETFLKKHMDKELYASIMETDRGKKLPQVAARVFLSDADWDKYMWIMEHGSLKEFKK